jgi:hypothetical protein
MVAGGERMRKQDWGHGSSGRAMPSKYKALSSNPITTKRRRGGGGRRGGRRLT